MLQGLGNLIVPLLCGYGFLTFCNYTKYRILRESGYHVLFRSAITGLTFLAVAHVAQEAARHFLPGNRTFLLLQNLIPIENPVTLAFTILLAVVSLALFNLKYDKVSAARKVAEQNGDFIELLIDRAITAGQSVELSLRSGKSYIGRGDAGRDAAGKGGGAEPGRKINDSPQRAGTQPIFLSCARCFFFAFPAAAAPGPSPGSCRPPR